MLKRPSGWMSSIALLAGLCAWLVVGGVVTVDLLTEKPTPTLLSVLNPTASNTPAPTVTLLIVPRTATPTSASTSTWTPAPTDSPTIPVLATAEPSAAATGAPSATLSAVGTTPGTAVSCTVPDGWVAHQVTSGDTLFGFVLGAGGTITVDSLMQGNCLKSKLLTLGQTLYLPPGAAENAPRVDSGPALGGPLPTGPTRAAHCPCTITVREGWRLEQIASAVDRVPVSFSGRDFLATVAAGAPPPDLAFLHSRPPDRSLEGFMFPGTYSLKDDTSAVGFRNMLLNAFGAAVSPQMQADAAARGYSFWQVLVIASMVQRESWASNEQKLIASVFYNRLAAGKAVATTVTLQYALGRTGNWWPSVHGSMVNINSPYNTYIFGGLPPSVIANPGLTAIQAAVYPPQTDFQYFSAKCGGGGNFYTKTWEEFQQGLKCGS
ncbi:MAG TPA: endolytic transglycosylase MltG [Aggregatilineaceae bacterium]|nr:endolytic transglycosylase MltG [Aggregatilineaceae bacterium]